LHFVTIREPSTAKEKHAMTPTRGKTPEEVSPKERIIAGAIVFG
jgi:hypothetical protein